MSDNLATQVGGNVGLTSGAFAAGTTTGTFQNTASITYAIGGVIQAAKGATNNVALSAHGSQAAGTSRIYGIFLDAAGNYSTVQGPAANTADIVAGNVALQWPASVRLRVMVGAFQVRLTSGAPFVPGTDALTTTGNRTVTFYNLLGTPANPITA